MAAAFVTAPPPPPRSLWPTAAATTTTTSTSVLVCKLRVRVVSVGRNKTRWLDEAVREYQRRLRATLDLETVWARDDAQLVAQTSHATGSPNGISRSGGRSSGSNSGSLGSVVLLDGERGEQYTSAQFAAFLYDALERGGSRVTFVLGGADGLPAELLRARHYALLSLSRLTLTHQMARLLLVEQIYRATEIRRGGAYPK